MQIQVVLVDDNSLLLEGIKKLFESVTDIRINAIARNEQEALLRIAECQPDIVVMDIPTPICNSISTIRQIKTTYPKTRILVLTSISSIEAIRMSLDAGAAGYILKQCVFHDLLAAIRAIYEGNSYFHPIVAKHILNGMVQTANGIMESSQQEVSLTERELEILHLVAEGLTNHQIAKQLFISEKTVQTHRRNLMDKLGFHDRVDLVKYAIRKGLIALH